MNLALKLQLTFFFDHFEVLFYNCETKIEAFFKNQLSFENISWRRIMTSPRHGAHISLYSMFLNINPMMPSCRVVNDSILACSFAFCASSRVSTATTVRSWKPIQNFCLKSTEAYEGLNPFWHDNLTRKINDSHLALEEKQDQITLPLNKHKFTIWK